MSRRRRPRAWAAPSTRLYVRTCATCAACLRGMPMTGGCPALMRGLCRVSERYTLRGVLLFGMSWPLPPVWVRQPASENGGKMLLPLPRFRGDAQPDAVIVDGAEPLPPVWGDASAPDPAFRMTFAACLGYALKYPRKRAARPLSPVWAAPWRKADSPAKDALGGAMLRGFQGAGGP